MDRLQADAWYLHVTRDGKLFFKNVENLKAKVATYARGKIREQREKELRERLAEMFKITTKAAYQKLLPLPALDQVLLQHDTVALVIFLPADDSFIAIEDFYNHQQFKNRVCFMTGAAKAYNTVLERAAELGGVRFTIMRNNRWIELSTPEDVYYAVPHFERGAGILAEFIPDGNLSMDIGSLKFDSGQQLLDMVAELKTELKEGEVRQ